MNTSASALPLPAASAPTVKDALGFLGRRKMLCIGVALPILATALFLAYWLPPVYMSQAKILIEEQSIPEDIVESSITSYVDQQIQIVTQQVLSRDSQRIIEDFDLYPELRASESIELAVSQFEQDTYLEHLAAEFFDPVRGRSSAATFAFIVGYKAPDAILAQQVTRELSKLYLAENVRTRTEKAAETTQFLEEEADRLSDEIAAFEQEMANFKDQYGESLPDQTNLTYGAIDRERRELDRIDDEIGRLRSERDLLQASLQSSDPEVQLAELRQRYSDDHPDVKRLMRQIEALRVEQSGSPEYIQTQTQIRSISNALNTAEARRSKISANIAALERTLAISPRIEKEWLELNRGYESVRAEFEEIKRRKMGASLSERLETENKGDRFTLLSKATLPAYPIEPNRFAIVFLGVVLALGAGIGLAILADSFDPTVRSVRDLDTLLGIKPLATIPVIETRADRQGRMLRRIGAVALGLGLLVAAWILLL